MRIVTQSVKLIAITADPEQQIETAARTCYKSESSITAESASGMVKRLRESGHHAMLEFADATFRVVTDRGITHEIVRHRLCSFAQESTRWCNYSQNRFGGDCTFIVPPDITEDQYIIWEKSCLAAEKAYFSLIGEGCSPQLARSVLPNSLKAEIVIKANLREWRHFISLRADVAAHPQIRLIAKNILLTLNVHAPAMFSDLMKRFI